MVVVAVAGGTGNVGRAIVETLLESAKAQSHCFGPQGDLKSGRLEAQSTKIFQGKSASANVTTIEVNYKDIEATAGILRQHDVHTVISTIQVTDDDSSVAQVNLIKAASLASPAKRFIASGWGALPNERYGNLAKMCLPVVVYKVKIDSRNPTIAFQQASDKVLRKSGLEWTRFVVGFFLDYYGIPSIKTHLPAMSFAVDIASKKAAIPGTGEEVIAFTYSYDVAKFVAAFLDVSGWKETTYCYGEKTTWNAFVNVAEDVTGIPFEVLYDPIEKLEKGEVTELPSHKEELANSPFPEPLGRQILALLGCWTIEGQFDVPVEASLNRMFPNIKPLTVRDVLLFRQWDRVQKRSPNEALLLLAASG